MHHNTEPKRWNLRRVLYWEVAPSGSDDQLGHVTALLLTLAPGISTETITATCAGAGTLTNPSVACGCVPMRIGAPCRVVPASGILRSETNPMRGIGAT